MYKVYFLDGYEIKNVENVEFGHQRNIIVHNGLGSGNFPVPDAPDLKTWTVQTEQSDNTTLFDILETMLETSEPSRLIITSDAEKTSEQVYVESYNKNEIYSGTYTVIIKFVEYDEVSVKTVDVPYIPRPGKIPTPPKTVVFNKNSDVYKALNDFTVPDFKDPLSRQRIEKKRENLFIQEKHSGGYVNPCLVDRMKEYNIVEHIQEKNDERNKNTLSLVLSQFGIYEKNVAATLTRETMGKASEKFKELMSKKK